MALCSKRRVSRVSADLAALPHKAILKSIFLASHFEPCGSIFAEGLNDYFELTTKITCRGKGTVSAIDLHLYLHEFALEKFGKHFSKYIPTQLQL